MRLNFKLQIKNDKLKFKIKNLRYFKFWFVYEEVL